MAEEIHEDRTSLEKFLEWSTRRAYSISKQKSSNKNQLQALLLGVGLYLWDLDFVCFTDYEETPVPDYLAQSKMVAGDADCIEEILRSLLDIVLDPRYVVINWVR